MAAIKGLSCTLLCASASLRLQSSARLCPLLIQTRNRNLKKPRTKAPHVAKSSDAWSKVVKHKTLTYKDRKAVLSPVFLSRVPVDDVWIRTHYPRPKFPLEECLVRHKEFADPSMLDNMEGLVYADMELNMKTNKKTKFLSNVKGTILLPHQFQQPKDQKVIVFCKTEEDQQIAKSLGATFVGCEDIVKQITEGLIDKDDIDVFLCTPDAITDLIPIRAQLRDKFPTKARGSVGGDVEEMWKLYTEGVSYASQKETDALARLQIPLGQLKMPVEQLVDNFQGYVNALCKGRAKTLGPLITQIFIIAPPSLERFLLPVEDYVPGYEKTEVRKAEEEESDSEDETEELTANKK
ncbi:large ribosomal subunit protein uL1m-like [Littorina saxatilis]|uniref:Mitochondrial ribosomal protein L1 n=1 Tax=Littorina saxatilis TaxID=31220 RepID=A0AAN9BXS5_9CAEN